MAPPASRSRLLPVTTAAQSAARDADAIAAGIPSRALMQRAGAAAAAEIALRYADRLARGVVVFAGPGNNGGDGWVVARALRAAGVRVRVIEPVPAKTDDARFEKSLCHPERSEGSGSGAPKPDPSASPQDDVGGAIVVDALLGTGSSGEPRGPIADALHAIAKARDAGATIVALDLPSGLDATTGEATHAVPADLTLTFGTIKRGHLIARATCGRIAVLDIGLDPTRGDESDPRIVDESFVATIVPPIGAESHKGTRRKLAIIGGAPGMAGAAILAARAALRSGIGMVKLVVAPDSLNAVQRAEPLALAGTWPADDDALDRDILDWADALVLGPGLGNSDATRALAERVLAKWRGPVVLDADGLNVFAGDLASLAKLLDGRPALLTPHPAEAARLNGSNVDAVLANRFDLPAQLARDAHATVLLKGVPTIVSDGAHTLVSASGTPVLAAAGSGDILSGIAGTLLAQVDDALHAGAAAAWVHGRAAELAGDGRVRGVTLDEVLAALPAAWPAAPQPTRYPVLLELPRVGERDR